MRMSKKRTFLLKLTNQMMVNPRQSQKNQKKKMRLSSMNQASLILREL